MLNVLQTVSSSSNNSSATSVHSFCVCVFLTVFLVGISVNKKINLKIT